MYSHILIPENLTLSILSGMHSTEQRRPADEDGRIEHVLLPNRPVKLSDPGYH